MLVLLRDLQQHQSPIPAFLPGSCQRSEKGGDQRDGASNVSRDLGRVCLPGAVRIVSRRQC